MPGRPFPSSGSPFSRDFLDRWSRRGPLREFLDYYAIRDVCLGPAGHGPDDFFGDAINLDLYAVANGGGASVASYAIEVAREGKIRATTGTGNGDTTTCTIVTPEQYLGDANCMCEVRHSPVTAVTETRIEVGFSDDIPDSDKSHVNVLATPSVNATVVDAALDTYDHTSSTTTNQLTTIGTSIDAVKTTFTPAVAVVAATYMLTRIMCFTNFVVLWRDGVLVAKHGGDDGTAAVEGGSLMAWTALIRASNATSKSHDIDYVLTAQNRS